MIWNAFIIALREMVRNPMRTILTVLGIFIGVASIITMVTLGQGTTLAMKAQIASLGNNLLTLRSGWGARGLQNLSEDDALAISHQIAGVAGTAPVRNAWLSTVHLQNTRTTNIIGTTVEYFRISRWSLTEGRFFSQSELRSGAAVCVIGSTVQKELFGSVSPVGTRIRIGRSTCLVVGLLASKGQVGMGGDQDDNIIMPLTTHQRRFVGSKSMKDINQIAISAMDGTDMDQMIYDITLLMRQRRNLKGNQDNTFNIFDTRQISDALSSTTHMMTMLLTAVAGVSLLVGGIGIMNIMLVSVTERTREIGIRLAIGATSRDVLLQFLVEAVTLSCLGGLAGILMALVLSMGLAKLIHVPFIFNLNINLIAFAFSAVIGIIFGYAPARRAARMNPIDALRHE